MNQPARKSPDFIKKSVMYQMFLRPFTPEGTLDAAARLLPNIAALGFDIVYLCPIVEADDDPRVEFWSQRQKISGCNNPRNPYRMADFYRIDPEYGDDEALERFVRKSHALGLKVILDLVYLHCGPSPVFLEDHPDYMQLAEDGTVKNGPWCFPLLNYESPALREYLWSNMEYFINRFDVDGYRCDVGDGVPLDFWEEGRRRIEALKPDVFMLNEGMKPDALLHAFDLNYEFGWQTALCKALTGEDTVQGMVARWQEMHDKLPEGGRVIRFIDTHDVANESYDVRLETLLGTRGVEAALVINYTLDGMPFVYNGYEVCDTAKHNIFANREHGRCFIDWSGALTEKGQQRMTLLCELNDLRHTELALQEGQTTWLSSTQPDRLAAFTRTCGSERILVLVNTADAPLGARVDLPDFAQETADELLEYGSVWNQAEDGVQISLLPRGYAVIKY